MSSGPQNGHFRPLAPVIQTRENVQMLRVKTFIYRLVRPLINRLERWLFGYLRPTPAFSVLATPVLNGLHHDYRLAE